MSMNVKLPAAVAGVKEKLAGAGRSRALGGKGGRRRRLALALAAVAVIAAGFGIYRLFFAQEERLAVTGTTTYGALNEAIQGSGTTTPADSVTYEITGKVLEWNVEAGQEVKAGDLLYVLDSSEAEDAILEYEVDLEDLYEQRADIQEEIDTEYTRCSDIRGAGYCRVLVLLHDAEPVGVHPCMRKLPLLVDAHLVLRVGREAVVGDSEVVVVQLGFLSPRQALTPSRNFCL